jgi:hypothetical protein
MNGRPWAGRRLCSALLLCTALFGPIACGGGSKNPVTPSPSTASVAGTWVGTVTFTSGTTTAQENIQMLLVQTEGTAAVTGSYQAEQFSGNIRGQATADAFTGTFDFTPMTAAMSCTGTFEASGPAGGTTMTLTSASLVAAAPCTNPPTNLTITVQKR